MERGQLGLGIANSSAMELSREFNRTSPRLISDSRRRSTLDASPALAISESLNNDELMKEAIIMQGKVVIVTGAAKGIGRHAAHTLARAGAKVALADTDVERLQKDRKSVV